MEPLAGDRGNEGDIASRLLPAALQVGGNKIPEALEGDRTGEARRALQADAGERLQASAPFHLYRRGEPGGAVRPVGGNAGGYSRRAGGRLQVVATEPQAGGAEAAGEARGRSGIRRAADRERGCTAEEVQGE